MDRGDSNSDQSHVNKLVSIGVIQRSKGVPSEVHRGKAINNDNPVDSICNFRSERLVDITAIRQREDKVYENE